MGKGIFTCFAPYGAKQPDKIKLNFAVLSDIHIDSRRERISKLHKGLHDIERSQTPNDVFVSVGDNTDHGYKEQWEIFEKVFSSHKPADKSILVLGNHDRRTKDDDEKASKDLFFEYSRKISGRSLEHLYFSEVIKGYTFIELAEDYNDGLSEQQIAWFASQLQKASTDSKPIFVFMHESLNISHGLPYTWERKWDGRLPNAYRSGVGRQSDEIEALMKQYKNVFYFSGHIHLGLTGKREYRHFGYSNFETDGSLHKINVPCFMFPNHHGLPTTGIGYQLEVYEDRVILRPRSYASSVWYSAYEREFVIDK